MSKFTKQIKKNYEFEGDKITVKMKRLSRKDAIELAPHMSEPAEDGSIKMSFENSLKFMNVSSDILLRYVVELTGLSDDEGSMLAKEDVFGEDSEVYFMTLISEIMADLMEASFIGNKKIVKKSNKKLQENSKESQEDMRG